MSKLTHEHFASLHRHWVWVELMKKEFYRRLPVGGIDDPAFFLAQPAGTYMCLWYALLFAVCEILRETDTPVPDVQQEIDEVYDSLRLFRNAVFHCQPKYWSEKLNQFIAHADSANKVIRLHDGISRWFFIELDRRKAESAPQKE